MTFTQIREWPTIRRLVQLFQGNAHDNAKRRKVVHFLSFQAFLFSLKLESPLRLLATSRLSCRLTLIVHSCLLYMLGIQSLFHLTHRGNCLQSGRPNSRCCGRGLMTFKSTDWKERVEFRKARGIRGIRPPLNLSAPGDIVCVSAVSR